MICDVCVHACACERVRAEGAWSREQWAGMESLDGTAHAAPDASGRDSLELRGTTRESCGAVQPFAFVRWTGRARTEVREDLRHAPHRGPCLMIDAGRGSEIKRNDDCASAVRGVVRDCRLGSPPRTGTRVSLSRLGDRRTRRLALGSRPGRPRWRGPREPCVYRALVRSAVVRAPRVRF